jgi:hypothetical protein
MKKLIILMALLACSCSSRKKTVESVKSKFHYDAAVDTAFSFAGHLKKQSLLSSTASYQEQNTDISFEGQCAGDSVSISQYGADGSLVSRTTVQGKGKVNLHSGQRSSASSSESNIETKADSTYHASGSVKINTDAYHETLDKTVKSEGFNWFHYLWLPLLLLLAAALWWGNKKYQWLANAKSHVTGLFSK